MLTGARRLSCGFLNKIGIFNNQQAQDMELVQEFLELLKDFRVDFTLGFYKLSGLTERGSCTNEFRRLFDQGDNLEARLNLWLDKWRSRIQSQKLIDLKNRMNAVNPAFIPRNHHVELMIEQARQEDYSYFNDLLECLSEPYHYRGEYQKFFSPPPDKDTQYVTFCGT